MSAKPCKRFPTPPPGHPRGDRPTAVRGVKASNSQIPWEKGASSQLVRAGLTERRPRWAKRV